MSSSSSRKRKGEELVDQRTSLITDLRRLRDAWSRTEMLIVENEAELFRLEKDPDAPRVSELDAKISRHTIRRSHLEKTIDRLQPTILKLEAELETINNQITALQDRKKADYFDLVKSLGAPSSLQKPKNWRKAQEDCVYLCHCPPEAEPPLPLTLVHPVFATFVDRFNNSSTIQFGNEECKLVFDVCSLVAQDFSRETEKMERFNDLLGLYMQLSIKPITVLGYTTDGSVQQNLHMVYTSEAKKDEGNALFQGIHYYGLFLAAMDEGHREKTACPCFLLELMGVHVRISGLVYLNKVACQPLTTFMHCYINAYDKTDMECLCKAFWALKQGIAELRQFYLSNPPQVNKMIPYPLQEMPVQVVERIATKLVFVVKLQQSEEQRLVKYCKRYGNKVHETWAAKGLAPRLFDFCNIAGGWFAIEMEYLPHPEWRAVHRWPELLDDTRKISLQLAIEDAMQVAHSCKCEEKEVAHGDMRAPNILARAVGDSFQIKFLDFDWAGAVASTTYPAFINTSLPWHGDVGPGKLLSQEHDRWWANKWTDITDV